MTAITVKISKEEKDLYHKICKREDTTMSQAIRAYIREQIKRKKVYLDEQERG
jgi:predicted transcriptional regulator